jgi:hypothetical protein
MRPLWIIAVIVCGVFALATAASASVRHEISTAAAAVAESITVPSEDEAPSSPEPSATVIPTPSPEPSESEEAGDEGDGLGGQPDNHGAAVSAVAGDRDAVGVKTLRNGRTVANHGQAVSAIARSGAGKPVPVGGASGEGAGKGGGH